MKSTGHGASEAKTPVIHTRVFWLGVATGLRSQTGLAMVAWRLARADSPRRLPRLLADPRSRTALTLGVAGELVADKLPIVPTRTDPGPLAGRAFFGALTGVATSEAVAPSRTPRQVAVVGAIGMTGAVAGSYAGRGYRAWATKAIGLPDLAAALIEDGVAAGLALIATARRR